MFPDQAAISLGFDFRRYAIKPLAAKPRSSIAQMEGSGVAVASVGSEITGSIFELDRV
jgi:hypothetical protein